MVFPHLRRNDATILSALWHRGSPHCEVGKPKRRAVLLPLRGDDALILSAFGNRRFPRRHKLNIIFFLPCGHRVSPSGDVGTPARRAARWGRLWGYAPFSAPLASPPKHPLRAFSASLAWRGHASCAAGASFPRFARSGDLPPRRVMPDSASALIKVRFSQNSNCFLR